MITSRTVIVIVAFAVGAAWSTADDVERLAAQLRGRPSADRLAAAHALMRRGPGAASATAELACAAVHDVDPEVRQTCVQALGRMGSAAVPAIAIALEDPAAPVRRAAVGVLAGLGPPARGALAALARALHDPDNAVRRTAIRAVAALGGAARHAAVLDAMLDDADPEVRAEAAAALATVPRDVPLAIAGLAAAAQDVEPAVRAAAVRALCVRGSGAREAMFALIAACSDADADVRRGATCALLGILLDPNGAGGPVAVVLLGHPDPTTRVLLARLLLPFGAARISACESLAIALPSASPEAVLSAHDALCDLVAAELAGVRAGLVSPNALERAAAVRRALHLGSAIGGLDISGLGELSDPLFTAEYGTATRVQEAVRELDTARPDELPRLLRVTADARRRWQHVLYVLARDVHEAGVDPADIPEPPDELPVATESGPAAAGSARMDEPVLRALSVSWTVSRDVRCGPRRLWRASWVRCTVAAALALRSAADAAADAEFAVAGAVQLAGNRDGLTGPLLRAAADLARLSHVHLVRARQLGALALDAVAIRTPVEPPDESHLPLGVGLLGPDARTRQRARERLWRCYPDRAAAHLAHIALEAHGRARREVLLELACAGRPGVPARDVALTLLASTAAEDRWLAVAILSRIDDPAARAAVERAITDPDPRVRALAAAR